MATLTIRKISDKVWKHTPSDGLAYIVSRLYIKSSGDKIRVVEFNGAIRSEYNYSDIVIYNIGGSAETGFTSSQEVLERLEDLGYIGFFNEGGASPFNPSDYDLNEFTNSGVDKFAKISDIPTSSGGDIVYNIGIGSQYSFGGWGVSNNSWATPPREISSITSITSWNSLYNGTTITDVRIGKLFIPTGYKIKEILYYASESVSAVSEEIKILAFDIVSNAIANLQTVASLSYSTSTFYSNNIPISVTSEITQRYLTFALYVPNNAVILQQGIISIILTQA